MCDGTNNNHVTQHPIQKESTTKHRFSKKKSKLGNAHQHTEQGTYLWRKEIAISI